MKHSIHLVLAVAAAAAALSGCSKNSSVEAASGSRLTLVNPSAITVQRGGMTKADIRIVRKDLPGEVKIAFTHLPKGVEVVNSDSRIVGDVGTYTLRAGADADLVENHSASVTASAQPGDISVSEPIRIDVRAQE